MPTKQEFIQTIKNKYPVYKDIEDNELYDKIVNKYPQYEKSITDTGEDTGFRSDKEIITNPYRAETIKNLKSPEEIKIFNELEDSYDEMFGSGYKSPSKKIYEFNKLTEEGVDYKDAAEKVGLNYDAGSNKVSLFENDQNVLENEYQKILSNRLKKKEESEKDPFMKDVWSSLNEGAANMMGGIYDVLGLATQSEAFKKTADIAYEEAEIWANEAQRGDSDITGRIKSGDIKGAVSQSALQLTKQIPMLTSLALGNYAGYTKAALGLMGGTSSTQQYRELKDSDLPEVTKIMASVGYGLSEMMFESIGTVKILNNVKKTVKELGEKEAKERLSKMYANEMERVMSGVYGGTSNAIREGASEWATTFTDNLIDKTTNNPNKDIFSETSNSFIVGMLMGKGMSVPVDVINAKNYIKEKLNKLPENMPDENKPKAVELLVQKDELKKQEDVDDAFEKDNTEKINKVNNDLTELIKEEPKDVIQGQVTDEVTVQPTPEISEEVGKKDIKQKDVTGETAPIETEEKGAKEIKKTITEIETKPPIKKELDKAKKVTFEFIGQERTGEVIEEKDDYIKVKDTSGTVHVIEEGSKVYKNIKEIFKDEKQPATIEDRRTEEIIKEDERIEPKEAPPEGEISLDDEIRKIKGDKLTEKENEVKQRLKERLQRLSGNKFVIEDNESRNNIANDIYGVINDLAELGVIKLEKGIDHVIKELKKHLPNKNIDEFKDDIKTQFGIKEEAIKYETVLKSIKTRKTAEAKHKEIRKSKGKEWFNKLVVDKPENFRQKIIEIDKETGRRAANYFNLQAGMSAKSKYELKGARKKIFGGFAKEGIMPQNKQELLSEYIDKKRIIELDNLYDKRGDERLKHEGGVTGEMANEFIKGVESNDPEILSKYSIENIDVDKLKKSSDEYYDVMRGNLKRLNEEGIVSNKAYEKLKGEQPFYSRRMYLDYIDKINLNGIEALSEGSESSKVIDIQTLLGDNITRTNWIIASNKARKAIADIIESNPNNEYLIKGEYSNDYLKRLGKEIKKPEKDREYIKPVFKKAPDGFSTVNYYEDGKSKVFYMDNNLYSEFENNTDPEWLNITKNILGWASGTKLLKAAATGYNPEFAVKNIPLDMLHIMTTTEEYNPIYPVATAQLLSDIKTVWKDATLRKGRFKDFIEQGGGMEYLTTQGSLTPKRYKKYTNINHGLQALGDVAAYMGNTSEILTRLALRERAINNKLKELKKQGITPTKENIKEIEYEATAIARNYLDFSQGGHATKFLDSVIPYFNAGIQVTRGTLRAAKNNPKIFWYKIGQLGATAAAITAYNMGLYNGGDEEEKDERAEYYKNEISDRNKSNNFVIMTNINYLDQKGNKRYLYIKIPKDQAQQLVTGLSEDLFMKYAMGDKEHQIMNDRRLMEFKALTKNVGDVAGMPPVITAITGYKNNINLFYNEAIWYGDDFGKDKSQEYTVGRTPERFVKWGELTGMSPERTRYAVQQFITQNNVFGSMAGEALDFAATGIRDELKQELNKTTAEKIKKAPFARRYISETSPYSKPSISKTTQQQINVGKAKNDHEIDRLIESDKSPDEIMKTIASKEPREAKRLFNNYIRDIKSEGVKKEIKELPFYSPEARAIAFWNIIKNKKENEIAKIIIDSKRIGGVITKGRFMEELTRIILEDSNDVDKIKKLNIETFGETK